MMKTAAKATMAARIVRGVALCSLFGMMVFTLAGCELSSAQSTDDICAFVESVAQSTEKSLANRNTTLARDTWSDLSEQGLSATNQGAEELGKAIGRLAGTYSDLVAYCENGGDETREAFLKNFQKEAEKLSALLTDEGFDTTKLDERIAEICGV